MDFNLKLGEEMKDSGRIYRNLTNLFSTRKGTIPINRDFGIDWSILAEPMDELESDFMAEAVAQVAKYVPEVTVEDIEFTYDHANGIAVPTIHFEESES